MADLRFLPDLDALVAPLDGDAPGGSKQVFRDLRPQVDPLREEINPELFGENDPARPKEFKPADWAGVLRLCLPALQDQAKDLQIARWVVDALPRREEIERGKTRWAPGRPPPTAFAALADGLTLLRRLTLDGWDYILPPFDPDEPDCRNGSFDWLGDDNTGAALPQLVRLLPLAVTPTGAITQYAWANASGAERTGADQQAAAAEIDHLQAVMSDIERCRTELAGLRAFLDEKLGELTPGMTGLRTALDDCHGLVRGLIQQKTGGDPVAVESAVQNPSGGDPSTAPAGRAASPAATREAAYQQLRQAAELLRRLEPHSPVPYLVMRAVDLGSKSFPDMIRSFVRDDSIMSELRRELNIPDDVPAE